MNKEHDFKRHTVAFGREGDALSLDTLEPYCDRKEFDIQIDAIARAILQFKNTQGGNDKVELLIHFRIRLCLAAAISPRRQARHSDQNQAESSNKSMCACCPI